MPRNLAESVVVITGASSGIGRATALEFARKGARLVLAARRTTPLEELARECEQVGTQAVAVRTDVTDEQAVKSLANRALQTFGRVDVWINNAGAAVFGRFDDVPVEDHLRVLQTNLIGTIYGSRAALAIFRRQGGGVLINTGSLDSKLAEPHLGSYTAAKHGIAGLGMSLRQELAINGANDIHVCTIMPQTVDTPFFQHAANYSGRAVRAMPPVLPAERVAQVIVRLARRPRREVFVGMTARLLWLRSMLAPGLAERMLGTSAARAQLAKDEGTPQTQGSLYHPMMEGTGISGGWLATSGESGARKETRRSLASGLVPLLPLLSLGLLFWSAARARAHARD